MRPIRTVRRVVAIVVASVLPFPAAIAAPACMAASGPLATPLVELYTSEGCDSCPPADRWMAAQFPAATAPGTPIALAFHVDYWDRLGWVDRFASPAFTERQYEGVRVRKDAFAYTPQLLLQGRDFAAWRRDNARAAIDAAGKAPARANVELTAAVDNGSVRASARAHVADAALARAAVVTIAYADSGHVSDVKAGENRGVRLTHDHVVRALASGRTGALDASATFAQPAELGAAATVVAFVQSAATGEVLQAVALPLADCKP